MIIARTISITMIITITIITIIIMIKNKHNITHIHTNALAESP